MLSIVMIQPRGIYVVDRGILYNTFLVGTIIFSVTVSPVAASVLSLVPNSKIENNWIFSN